MSLDVAKLEKVRELAGGIVQARCPACAEGGHDRTGEHLRIYPDGRFGCCVHPKDGEHRKRVWALVGCKLHRSSAASVSLRIKVLAHGHHSTLSAQSVKAALTAGTLGTGKTEPETGVRSVSSLPVSDAGTPGTGNSKLRACAREDLPAAIEIYGEKLKDLGIPVPSVPSLGVRLSPMAAAPCGEPPLPFLTAGGTLVIPMDSPERYHWWKLDGERLSVAETLSAVKERMKLCR